MDSSWLGGSSTRSGFALVPPGSVMAANISACSTNTPTITYSSNPSGWGVDRQGSWPVLLSGDYSMTEQRPHGWALTLKTHRTDTTLIHQVASPHRWCCQAFLLLSIIHLFAPIWEKADFSAPSPIKGYRHLDKRWNHPFIWRAWATMTLILIVAGWTVARSLAYQDTHIRLSLI